MSRKISTQIKEILKVSQETPINLGDLVAKMSAHGYMLPALVLSLPFLLPIPLPGLSTVFGLMIGLLGIGMFLNLNPWIPQRVRQVTISPPMLVKIFAILLKISSTLEQFVRPRLLAVSQANWNLQLNGAIVAICGLFLAIPLPPGTNIPPATTLVLVCLGDIEDDGLVLIFAYITFIANIILFTAIFLYGTTFLQHLGMLN